MDSSLFLIKMLLILREQVSPFEISYYPNSNSMSRTPSNKDGSSQKILNDFSFENELEIDIGIHFDFPPFSVESQRQQQGGIFGYLKNRVYSSNKSTNTMDSLKVSFPRGRLEL